MSDPESIKSNSQDPEGESPTEEFLAAVAYVPPSGLESLYPPTTHDIVGPLDQLAIPDCSVFEPLIDALPPSVMTAEQLFEALAAEEPPLNRDDTSSAEAVYDSESMGTDTQPAAAPQLSDDGDGAELSTPWATTSGHKVLRFAQMMANTELEAESHTVKIPELLPNHVWHWYPYQQHHFNLSSDDEIRASDEYQSHEGMFTFYELQSLSWVINYFLSLAHHLQIFDVHFFFDDLAVTELVTHDENWARKFLWHHFGKIALMPGGIGSDVSNPDDAVNRELKQGTVSECVAVGLEYRRLALWFLFAGVFGENQRILPYPEPPKPDATDQQPNKPTDEK